MLLSIDANGLGKGGMQDWHALLPQRGLGISWKIFLFLFWDGKGVGRCKGLGLSASKSRDCADVNCSLMRNQCTYVSHASRHSLFANDTYDLIEQNPTKNHKVTFGNRVNSITIEQTWSDTLQILDLTEESRSSVDWYIHDCWDSWVSTLKTVVA